MGIFYKIFLIILCLGLFACQKKERGKGGQEIRINFSYTPLSVDPRKSTDPVTTVMNLMLYEGLTRLEEDGTVSLALAERIKISKDKTRYRFYLRESMWSDGSPLTAYHFEAAWKKALSPDFSARSSHLLFPIKNGERAKKGECSIGEIGVVALDEYTLEVNLKRPTPYFLELTSYPAYFPVPFNGDEVPHPSQQEEVLGSGPFVLTGWKNEDEISFAKNPYYWNAEEVKLDEIHAIVVAEECTALSLFEKGELDIIGGLTSALPLDAIATLKESGNLRKRPIAGTTFCTFNVHKFPFNNVNIRKAFSYAINRQELIDNVSQMFDDLATGPVPPILKKTAVYFFDDFQEELARNHFERGLEELGITKEEFPKITYQFFSSELHKKLAIALQSYWKKTLDVEVSLRTNEFKTHLSKLHYGDYSIAQMSWIGQYHDPMSFLERFITKDAFRNYTGWENPEFTRLIKMSYYKERTERDELLSQAEGIIADEMPIIPLYHYHAIYIKNPKLQRVAISPMGDIQFHKAYVQR